MIITDFYTKELFPFHLKCEHLIIIALFKWGSRHAQWRRIAKKLRRKRIRQKNAQERDLIEKRVQLENEKSPSFRERLENEEKAEILRLQEEQRIHDELEAKWLETERIAQIEWKELQIKLEQFKKERARQNAKIREEFELEKKKLREAEETRKKEIEEKIKQQELLQKEIDNFANYGGEVPEHLKTDLHSNPGKTICPFFHKTSACRFGDTCSRNHVRPGISRIILIQNFYSHYCLEQTENEHGNSALEFENNELYSHFKNFFYDIVPEIEKFGNIKQVVVCCNTEIHLRGNVYVEYSSEREALVGLKSLNGRWYAGKQLSVQFSSISSWKMAICGLHHINKCPKGGTCNFIHRFLNPKQLYSGFNERFRRSPSRTESQISARRDWRWSESPEHENGNSDWEDTAHSNNASVSEENERKVHSRREYSSERGSRRSQRDFSSTRKKRKRSHSRSRRRKRSEKSYNRNHEERRDNSSEKRKPRSRRRDTSS